MRRNLVYTASPKYLAAFDPWIGAYIYRHGDYPLTPWMYPPWLLDSVERDNVRDANARYIDVADEVAVFACRHGHFHDEETEIRGLGIHDGVRREIEQAFTEEKPVTFHLFDVEHQRIASVNENGYPTAWWSISNYATEPRTEVA